MSFQQQQQQDFVNPNTATLSSSHSSGSFGSVFVVLAVIVVLSAAACFLSRLCSKRHHHRSPKQIHQRRPTVPEPERREPKQGHHGNFNDRVVDDIEFGFAKKQFGNGEVGKGAKKGKPGVGFEFRGDMMGGGERELKGGEFSAI